MGGVSKYIMEVKVIGQMDNTIDHTFESANRVYDVGGCCPTINTCGGGGLQPKIIQEVKELGFMDNVNTENIIIGGEQEHQAIKKDGVCTTLTSSMGTGGGYVPMVLTEQSIVAMRGRNPENPSDRTVGAPTEQRLEPNSQGICNTLTSVTKDNLVLEKNIAALRMVRTEEGKALRKQYENHEITHGFNEHRVAEPREDGCSNTLSTVQKDNMLLETVRIKQATKDGYIECKVGGVADLSFPDSTTRRGRVQDGGDVCPTLMAGEQDICRIEKKCISTKGKENDVASTILSSYERLNMTGFNADNGVLETKVINPLKGLSDNGWHFEQNVYDSEGIVRSVKAGGGSGNIPKVIETQYRIRKLTPRECYRLMAVPEESIDKMLEVNSNTQCYKQAGNSIVVNCLVAIFSQMGIQGIPRWNEGLSEKYK